MKDFINTPQTFFFMVSLFTLLISVGLFYKIFFSKESKAFRKRKIEHPTT